MNTTLASATTVAVDATAAPGVTQRRVLGAEWIKLRTVRSTVVGLASGAAVMILLGTLFSAIAGDPAGGAPNGPGGGGSDPFSRIFGGSHLTQLIVSVVGAVFVTTEYSTGLMRTMFSSVIDRRTVLAAKVGVVGLTTWATMTAAAFLTFFVGSAVYGGSDVVPGLGDDGVLRAILGTGVYISGVAVMGVALGFLLRTTASAVGVLVAGLMVAPVLVGLLPDSISDNVGKLLPSNAGTAFTSVVSNGDLLSPHAGLVVFAAWVVGLVAAAAVMVRRRDA